MTYLSSNSRGDANLLARASASGGQSRVSVAQLQLDALSSSFSAQACDWPSLASMTLGSFAYRAAKLGILSSGLFRASPWLGRLLAPVASLAAEVSVYRSANAFFAPRTALHASSWLGDFVNFGSLKLFGRAAAGVNPIGRHALQDAGMVAGHRLAHVFGLEEAPQGGWAEQFLHAEAMNLQMQAGMALMGILSASRLARIESSLDLGIQARENFTGPSRWNASQSPFRVFAAESTARARLVEEIRLRIDPLQYEVLALEGFRRGIVRELGEAPHAHEKYAFWMDQLDQVNTRYLELSREYLMLVAMFEPKGGAEKWGEDRLQGVLRSAIRALDRSRKFLDSRPPLETDASAGPMDSITPTSLQDLRRMYEKLNLPNHLAERLFATLKSSDAFTLNGLEGLEGLMSRGGRDEIQALTGFLERVCSSSPPDVDSLQELIILGMNYQLGLLSRSSVLEIVARVNQFHAAYPQAVGSFIEIFAKMHPHISKDSALMAQVLHFAQVRLERGERVTVQHHGHFGVAVMKVREVEGGEYYYGLSTITEEVADTAYFTPFVDRALMAVASAIERQGEALPVRIYLAVPRLTRRVTALHVRVWGADYLAEGAERVKAMLRETEVRRTLLHTEKGDERDAASRVHEARRLVGALWEARDLSIQQVEVAWYTRPLGADGRVMRRESRGEERLANTYEVINPQSLSRDQEIVALQEALRMPGAEAQSLTSLVDLLEEAGRHSEALEALRAGIQQFPNKKALRSSFALAFERDMARLLGPNALDLQHPALSELLSAYFGLSLSPQILSKSLNLEHPAYRYSLVTVDRRGSSLMFNLDVSDAEGNSAAQVSFNMTYVEVDNRWQGHLWEANVAEGHRGRGISTFVMASVQGFLRSLGVQSLTVSADEYGPYAWLRMGGEFSEGKMGVTRSAFAVYAHQLEERGLALQFPYPHMTSLSREEILANMQYLRRQAPDCFAEFVLRKLPGLQYYFDLWESSPSFQRFMAYFQLKRAEVEALQSSAHRD